MALTRFPDRASSGHGRNAPFPLFLSCTPRLTGVAHGARHLCIALALAGAGIALAQTAPSAAAAPAAYDIPAGALGPALSRFAAQSGITLSFEPSLTNGRTTAGLQGRHDAGTGFSLLLKGSGLEAVPREGGGYTLRAATLATSAAGAAGQSLAEVRVTAQAERGGVTEGTGSYTTPSMSTATKLDLALRETPQSVTVVTRQRMDDQAIASLTDVVRATPGVYLSNASGPGRPSFSARGFDVDYVMYEGFPTSVLSYLPSSQANLDMIDRVEVVRGAAGLAQGAGSPSAAINLVRKRPTREFQGSVTASAGSWDSYGAMADLGGPLNAAGTVRGRIVASGQDAKSFRDVEAMNHSLFYGVVEADLAESTLLTVGASRQKDHTNYFWGGLPISADGLHLGLPRSTFIGSDWEHADTHTNTVFGTLEHRFGNDWKLRLGAMNASTDLDVLATSVWAGQRFAWAQKMKQKETGYDLFASGPFDLLGRTHELVVGASTRQLDYGTREYYGDYLPGTVDPYSWNPHALAQPAYTTNSSPDQQVTTQDSVYLTTRLKLADPLKLILGGRLDSYDYDNRTDSGSYRISHNFTKYAGLIYDLDASHSVYASYTDVFKPQSSKDLGSNLLKPIVGKNYEAGIKGEYFDGTLNASAAVFRIDQTNRARLLESQGACPTYPATSCYEASGLVRSKGIDLEIQGAVTPRWQVGAGLTYTQTQYVKDAKASNIGKTFDPRNPTQLFKMTTLYRLGETLEGWRVGGSLYQQSRIYAEGASNGVAWQNEQKAYAVLDLVAGYRVNKQLDLQLNVNNVFDKTYYRNVSAGSYYPYDIYGDPRSIKLTAKYTF